MGEALERIATYIGAPMLPWGCTCGEAVNYTLTQHRSQRLALRHSTRRQHSLRRSIPTKEQLDRERDCAGRNLQTTRGTVLMVRNTYG